MWKGWIVAALLLVGAINTPITPPPLAHMAGRCAARATIYAQAFNYDAAVSAMNIAVQFAPDDPTLYVQRGQMWLLLYEWDSVLADYNTAIALDPTYAEVYFYRGVLYYSVLQAGLAWREEALADLEHYMRLAPEGDLAGMAQKYIDTLHTELEALSP